MRLVNQGLCFRSLKREKVVKLFELLAHFCAFALECKVFWLQKPLSVSVELVTQSLPKHIALACIFVSLTVAHKQIFPQ